MSAGFRPNEHALEADRRITRLDNELGHSSGCTHPVIVKAHALLVEARAHRSRGRYATASVCAGAGLGHLATLEAPR